MSEFLNDQEQEERVKKWLKTHGVNALSAVMLGLSAYFAFNYWQGTKANENAVASTEFQKIETQQQQMQLQTMQSKPLTPAQNTEFLASVDELVKKHPDSIYSQHALLAKAKYLVEKNELAKALTALKQAKEATSDDGIKNVVDLRMAKVLIADNKAKEAIDLLTKVTNTAFTASKNEILGDAYVALKEKDKAKSAYENAWKTSLEEDDANQILRLKMETLGLVPMTKEELALTKEDTKKTDTQKPSAEG